MLGRRLAKPVDPVPTGLLGCTEFAQSTTATENDLEPKYEASSLDWRALEHLAQLAARGTAVTPAPILNYVDRGGNRYVKVLGPHWVLDHRWEHSTWSKPDGIREESDINDVYALLPDGSLVVVRVSQEWVIDNSHRGLNLHSREEHTVRRMAEADVTALDLSKATYHWDNGQGNLTSNWRTRGLVEHRPKGSGLLRRLEALLRSRANPEEWLRSVTDMSTRIGALLDSALESRHLAERAAAAKTARERTQKSLAETASWRLKLAGQVWLFIAFVILATNYMANERQAAFVDGSYWVAAGIVLLAVAGMTTIDFTVGSGRDVAFVCGAALGCVLPVYLWVTDPLLNKTGASLVGFVLVPAGGLVFYGLSAHAARKT